VEISLEFDLPSKATPSKGLYRFIEIS